MSKYSERKSKNKEIMVNNKQNLRELEGMYVDSKISNLEELIEERKEDLTNNLIEYQKKFTRTKYDKDGNPYEILEINSYVIERYFFKSLNPMQNREPKYTAEKLSVVWELYQDILCEVNAEIGSFAPSLTSFCTFAGITLSTFRSYKNSNDIDMRTITEKINDLCFNVNVTLAQNGKLKERSTIYRMKSEQERAEKEQPEIHLHNHNNTQVVDFDALKEKLDSIQGYNKAKANVIEVEKNEQ